MATTGKKSHRGPVYRCQRCPWEGDKKGVSFHVITQHRDVMEGPYYCLICPAKFTSAKPWRRHLSTPGHRVRSVLRGKRQECQWARGASPYSSKGTHLMRGPWASPTQTDFGPSSPRQDKSQMTLRVKIQRMKQKRPPQRRRCQQQSANVTPKETMPVSKSPDLGSCTPCSIVLEDVVDLGLLPLGSFRPGPRKRRPGSAC